MRIFFLIAIGALLLSIAFAKSEDPDRLEDFTTQESILTQNVNFSSAGNFENNFQQPQDSDKSRNVRATQNISPHFFPENPWSFVETPILFEPSLQDKEKTKLVLIEPFFRVKKVEKGFWGWLKKILGEEKKKKGQGPLIGPIKVPGMGDNVFIRAVEPENEADHVVIHLVTKNQPLGSSEKGIKLESPLPLVNFDAIHGLPFESSNFQTIVSPHFSHEGLFDKSHFPVLDASWSSAVPSSFVNFASEKENFFSSPMFFRKHSTDNEGSEFPGTPNTYQGPGNYKDTDSTQEFEPWAQPHQYSSLPESYGNNEEDREQLDFYGPEDHRQFSSAREDIDNLQRTQTSRLELSENEESLPLYPPLFNGSFGQIDSNNRDEIYVTNGREDEKLKTSSGSKRDSSPYPGLGAYKTEFRIVSLPKNNVSNANFEAEYISNVGIQEVEAPNLSQAENRGIYQFSEIDSGLRESIEGSESNPKTVENSKRVRNSHSSDYGIYELTDSRNAENISSSEDPILRLNETDEALKTISASYPWEYRISKNRFDNSKSEENKKEVLESSGTDSQVQVQPENRNSSLSKSKTEGSKRNVRKEMRFRNRFKSRNQGNGIKKTENNKLSKQTVEDQNSDLRANKSKGIYENNLHPYKNETEGISKVVGRRNCSDKDLNCWEENEKEDEVEVKKPMTAEKVKEFFLKESKRFEELLKTVEEESEAVKEEAKKAIKEKPKTFEDDSDKDAKEELKIVEESKSHEKESKGIEENPEEIGESKVDKKEIKESQESKTIKEESKAIKEESRIIQEELKAVKEDLKAVKEELKVSKEKPKSVKKESKSIEEKPKSITQDSKLNEEKPTSVKKEPTATDEELKTVKEEQISSDIKNLTEPTENDKLNHKFYVVTPESRISNKSRLDFRLRKTNREEMRKSISAIRLEMKKPKIPIMDGHFKNKLKNNTNFSTRSTLKIEAPNTTPPSHILRMYAKNRSMEKLKINAKKEKKSESEENQEFEGELKKSLETEPTIEKPKAERVRISKFSPRTRKFKPKVDTKMSVTSD